MKITDLDHVLSFQKRIEESDGSGNTVAEFEEVFREWGAFKFLRGGESVVERRLASKQPAVLTVRRTAKTEGIAPDWRVVSGGRSFLIKEPPRPSSDRLFLEVLVESSPVTG